MNIIRSVDEEVIAQTIAEKLHAHLAKNHSVTWLLSGGSAISLEVLTAQKLAEMGASLEHMLVTLVDERYGDAGHENENWQQLIEAGFSLPGAQMYRVLNGLPAEETAIAFGSRVESQLATSDYSLGIFGIGADGHTAGIKAHSPASQAAKPAVFYSWDDHERITLTTPILASLSEVIIFARGAEKADTLTALIQKEVPIDEQPAQLLKSIAKATLYTDAL